MIKPPFKVQITKGGIAIFNGVSLVEYAKETETKEQMDAKCAWWNSIWEAGSEAKARDLQGY